MEKSWLKRLGVLTEKPPFPEEDEKDGGGLEESLAEEAAGRRGIAGNGQGEQRIGERLELEPLLHFPRSTSTAGTGIGNEDCFFSSLFFFSLFFIYSFHFSPSPFFLCGLEYVLGGKESTRGSRSTKIHSLVSQQYDKKSIDKDKDRRNKWCRKAENR